MLKTVLLIQVSTAFRGSAKQSSNYKRINRFMTKFHVPLDAVARFVVSMFPFPALWWCGIGRPEWKFGKKSINIFVLSICYGGIAVPILWKTLDKKANTNTQDRID
ncbi:MAG: IS4 family transposase, partial [Gammaproteobacteria bacterium]|nr:IS4 family transposase [Gammaproteobacteria bacterium]